jgi:hypothetical protein
MDSDAYSDAWDGFAGGIAVGFMVILVVLTLIVWGIVRLIRARRDLSPIVYPAPSGPPARMACARCGAPEAEIDSESWRCRVCGEHTHLVDARVRDCKDHPATGDREAR